MWYLLILIPSVVIFIVICATVKIKGAYEIAEDADLQHKTKPIVDPSTQEYLNAIPTEYPRYNNNEDGNSPQLVNSFVTAAIRNEGPKSTSEWSVSMPTYQMPTTEFDQQHVLYQFVQNNKKEMVLDLIRNGINLNCLNNPQGTVLHYAIDNNLNDMVKLLIENGARVDVMNHSRKTSIHEAIEKQNIVALKIILGNIRPDIQLTKLIRENPNPEISRLIS